MNDTEPGCELLFIAVDSINVSGPASFVIKITL